MAGHVRTGRRFLPELVASVGIEQQDWARDDLPDLLWPALVFAERGNETARDFATWQRSVQSDLGDQVDASDLAEALDGRMTSLDRMVARHGTGTISTITSRASEHGLLSARVAKALATYLGRPAPWLTATDFQPPDQDDVELIAKALLEAMTDGHREALLKCLRIWSAVQAGTFSSDTTTIELLKPYPGDIATRARADSVIRAGWGAARAAQLSHDSSHFDASIRWAKVFWGTNSMTTSCVRKRDQDADVQDHDAVSDVGALEDRTAANADARRLQQLAMDLVSSYVEALERAPARLYDHEPQEVHAGLVSRAGREVVAILGYPDLWCAEHGASVSRVLVEVRVYLQWMSTQDPSIYRRFQEYGSGKAKLYRHIMDEIPADAWIPGFGEAVEELERLSHNDHAIDYRVVDTSDSFAGKSIRAMAEECGLLDLYRHTYYISSGIAHSEWWSVETHAMECCLNVLHRCHLIPSLSLNSGGHEAMAQAWVDYLYGLINFSLEVLGTDKTVVAEAFSWTAEQASDPAIPEDSG